MNVASVRVYLYILDVFTNSLQFDRTVHCCDRCAPRCHRHRLPLSPAPVASGHHRRSSISDSITHNQTSAVAAALPPAPCQQRIALPCCMAAGFSPVTFGTRGREVKVFEKGFVTRSKTRSGISKFTFAPKRRERR